MLGLILARQKRTLINKGLTGVFNATIVKLMLSKHGYSEKVDQTVTGAVPVKEVDISHMSDDEIAEYYLGGK